MKAGTIRSEALLLLASAIWGFAFVAQRAGMEHVGPFAFNGVRFALGTLALLPFIIFSVRRGNNRPGGGLVVRAGIAAGIILFLGASLQQAGIVHTTAGKAGFITGLYVILVPILGLFLRNRTAKGTWAGAILAAIGLYLLSFTGRFTIGKGDVLVLAGTLFWAMHVLLIGRVVERVNPLVIAGIQFTVCSLLSLAVSLATETTSMAQLADARLPILYGGVMSVSIAYTLQVIAQRNTPPSHAAVILSLETVFAALGGWAVLNETIPLRGIAGCTLMLAGIMVSQLGIRRGHGTAAVHEGSGGRLE
ncbi:MAG TPA: DMT family transporter [Candidatus Krumholzibacterium sp.]|nr:DMT family transporter [Candidatus Krumholzibacterium sp.]